MYRQQYYEALDLVINSITARFDQPGFEMYCHLQELLLKALRGESWEDLLVTVTNFYGEDLNADQLRLHIRVLCANLPAQDHSSVTVTDIKYYIQQLSAYERCLISEVVTVVELILVLPSTNAVSERSFSAMRRLKTYLQSVMVQECLNHLLLLHVHKKRTDNLDPRAVAEEFVRLSEHRLSVFGHFYAD